MWNNEKPLKFLMSLPDKIGRESLKRLQSIIDEDRSLNREESDIEICGRYAPFCKFCDKTMLYPCAMSYVKLQQNDGLCIEVSESVYDSLKVNDNVEYEMEEYNRPNRIRIAIARKIR